MILRDQVIDTHIPRDDGAYADLHGAVVPFQVASSTLEAVSAGLMQEVSTVFAHAGFAKKDASTNIASVLLDYNGVGDEYSSDMRDVGYLLRMRRDPADGEPFAELDMAYVSMHPDESDTDTNGVYLLSVLAAPHYIRAMVQCVLHARKRASNAIYRSLILLVMLLIAGIVSVALSPAMFVWYIIAAVCAVFTHWAIIARKMMAIPKVSRAVSEEYLSHCQVSLVSQEQYNEIMCAFEGVAHQLGTYGKCDDTHSIVFEDLLFDHRVSLS